MPLQSQTSICFLNLVKSGSLLNAQYLIKVLFRRHQEYIIMRCLIILILALVWGTLSQRIESEVYGCVKKAISREGGSCRAELQQCYVNGDCSVEMENCGCSIKPTSNPWSPCKKWSYKTSEARNLLTCLDTACKVFS